MATKMIQRQCFAKSVVEHANIIDVGKRHKTPCLYTLRSNKVKMDKTSFGLEKGIWGRGDIIMFDGCEGNSGEPAQKSEFLVEGNSRATDVEASE